MSDERNEPVPSDEGQASQGQSPSEKLVNEKPLASSVPGAENPASTEIKRETNFNTE